MEQFIFFSYSRQDAAFVLQLGKDLRSAGVSIWLDQLDIKPGDRWDVAVEATLANCGRLLVILSPASVASTNVLDEVSYALEHDKPVIPILFQQCEIPFRLRRLQHIDFRADYDAALKRVLAAIEPGSPSAAAPETIARATLQSFTPPPVLNPGAARATLQSFTPPPVLRPSVEVASSGSGAAPGGFGRGTLTAGAVAVALAVLSAVLLVQRVTRSGPPLTSAAKEQPVNQKSVPAAIPAAASSGSAAVPATSNAQVTASASAAVAPSAATAANSGEARGSSALNYHHAYLVNVHSALCLTVAGGVRDRNATLVQYPCDGDRSRLWSIAEIAGTPFVTIRNSNSDLCATIAGGGTVSNTDAVQYTCDDDASRRWQVVAAPARGVRLVNARSGLCLTIAGGVTDRNAAAVQYPCDGDPARDWEIRSLQVSRPAPFATAKSGPARPIASVSPAPARPIASASRATTTATATAVWPRIPEIEFSVGPK